MPAGELIDSSYSLRRVQQALGVSRAVVLGLVSAGFVAPHRGPRNVYRFSFQDLLVLRTAHSLRQAQVPARRIVRALARLRAQLPAELPLSGLRITAVGADVAVREHVGTWHAESGQGLMEFEVEPRGGGSIAIVAVAAARGGSVVAQAGVDPSAEADAAAVAFAADPSAAADAAFDAAEALESTDAAAAEAGYRQALAQHAGHLRASLNLGALLCEQGRCDDAASLYAAALLAHPDAPLLHFNRAIALEDQQRLDDALDSYERALVLDPALADAHYNAARLSELRGDARRALRHYSAYRRLQRLGGDR